MRTRTHTLNTCLQSAFTDPKKTEKAENQTFKLFHGVQYCTFGLEKPSLWPRAFIIHIHIQVWKIVLLLHFIYIINIYPQ